MPAPSVGYSVATVADLKAIAPENRGDRQLIFVGDKNAWYRFSPSSTDPEGLINGTVITPDEGDGRWLMVTASSSGGGPGDTPTFTVQDGKPTDTPTQIGAMVLDERSDRSILWASVATDSPSDWHVFGSRPIRLTSSGGLTIPDDIVADFPGQLLIYNFGSSQDTVWLWTGARWGMIFFFSDS